jgi:hypothetical protein
MARLTTGLQWLLVAATGAASFYAAVLWRSASSAADPSQVASPRDSLRDAPRAPRAASAPGAGPAPSQSLAPLARPDRTHVVPQAGGEAFARLSWLPAPAPALRLGAVPPVAAAAAPLAPPLPFTFVGLLEQGRAKPQAFLAKGDTLLVVAAGDVIDNNTYRVDSLGAQHIGITYLPLNTPQTLTILGTTK